jgi:hypothetical protein
MALWLKDERRLHKTYSIAQINNLPTGAQAVSIVAGILATSLCMVYPIWVIFTIVVAIFLFGLIVLLIWYVPLALHCK